MSKIKVCPFKGRAYSSIFYPVFLDWRGYTALNHYIHSGITQLFCHNYRYNSLSI